MRELKSIIDNDIVNDNVNGSSSKKNSLTMTMKGYPQTTTAVPRKRHISARDAEQKADILAETLRAPGSRAFFLKCLYTLPEYVIWDAVEAATKSSRIKAPARYFVRICRDEMTKRGIE